MNWSISSHRPYIELKRNSVFVALKPNIGGSQSQSENIIRAHNFAEKKEDGMLLFLKNAVSGEKLLRVMQGDFTVTKNQEESVNN